VRPSILRIADFWRHGPKSAELEERIFEIAYQFNRASQLVMSVEERVYVAELNLIAGKRAKASTAHASR